jgi:hypothetical protein
MRNKHEISAALHRRNKLTDANETETETNFVWPTDPPEDWWRVKGASIGLDDDEIRFSAALFSLGGADSKKNSRAAQLAGLSWDRVQAFRKARSVSVRKLVNDAKKRGKLPPLTDEDIDQEVDDLIRCPDALTKARGIEIREKRKAAKRANAAADQVDIRADVAAIITGIPQHGLGA